MVNHKCHYSMVSNIVSNHQYHDLFANDIYDQNNETIVAEPLVHHTLLWCNKPFLIDSCFLSEYLVIFNNISLNKKWDLFWFDGVSFVPQIFTQIPHIHHNDIIMNAIESQITSVSIVYSTVCSSIDQRKHQSSTSLAFVRGIHHWPANSLHKGPVTQKMFPFDDEIM